MTERQYREEIRRACNALGVYRVEMSRTRCRLAQIYVDLEKLTPLASVIDERVDEITGKLSECEDPREAAELLDQLSAAVSAMKIHDRLDRLRRTALDHERALGMTADSVRKINEAVFTQGKEKDSLAEALRVIGGGRQ